MQAPEVASARVGPRERLMLSGEQSLSDAELLAVLLGTGTPGDPVSVVAQKLLEQTGGLHGLRHAGLSAMSACPGVGLIKACRLRAALELGMRVAARPFDRRQPIRSSMDVAAVLRPRRLIRKRWRGAHMPRRTMAPSQRFRWICGMS